MSDSSTGVSRLRQRLFIMLVVVVALLATLGVRLWSLQIRSGDAYAAAANRNEVRSVTTPAPRGQILDDMGRPLVNNKTGLVVTVDRSALQSQPDQGTAELNRLGAVLGMAPTDLQNKIRPCDPRTPPPCWNGSPYQPVPITTTAGTQQALQIMEQQELFPGVTAQPEAVLNYPQPDGANAAQILGYAAPATQQEVDAAKQAGASGAPVNLDDQVGAAGLESTYDSYLRGADGTTQLSVDQSGNVLGAVGGTPAAPGDDLVTSIDARVQAATEQQLLAAINRARSSTNITGAGASGNYKADSGAAVVMDVHTGQIIAMASYPTYDPSVWVGGISAANYAALSNPANGTPLLDRAYQGEFPPGSTFKVVSTSAAGMDGFDVNGTYDCGKTFSIGNETLTNFESEAFGPISLKRALEVSCDTVFYGIAYQMWQADGGGHPVANPKDPIQKMAAAYGLGQPTGLDLPGEAAGQVSNRQNKQANWNKYHQLWCQEANNYPKGSYDQLILAEDCQFGFLWNGGDAANEAIGQGGILLSPLQEARMYAAVANGGTLLTPTIGKAIVSPDGKVVKTIGPQVDGHVPVNPQTLSFLQNALLGVTTEGTAAPAYAGFPVNQIPVASKTGTAQAPNGQQAESWFATYAPANNPEYAVVMTVTQGGEGVATSGPSVAGIYKALYGVNPQGQAVPAQDLLPNAVPPVNLPVIRPDGTVVQTASFFSELGGADSARARGLYADGELGGPVAALVALPPAEPARSFTYGRSGRPRRRGPKKGLT